MKTRFILILLAGLVWGCTPADDTVLDLGYTLDKVVCQANSDYFVADGVSELGLEVKLYTKSGTYTDIYGQTQDTYMEVPKDRMRNHKVKFFDRSGKEYAPDFKSSSLAPGVIEFYAEVDGIRSSKPILQLLAENPAEGEPVAAEADPVFFKMNVRAAEPVPAKKRYPVVFHIIDTELARDRMQEINSDAIYYVIDLYNSVFGRKNSMASNGANPNIEFVPALRSPNGTLLKEPGINRIYLTASEDSGFGTGFVFGRSDMYWDYDKYLNIWIVTASSWSGTSEQQLYQRSIPFVFASGVYNADAFPLPASVTLSERDADGLAAWKIKPTNLENVGLVFHKTSFANLGPNYVSQMSAFLGVIPNSGVNATNLHSGGRWVDDFCDDTFAYNPYYNSAANGGIEGTDFGNARTKYTVTVSADGKSGKPGRPWIIYSSCNTGEQSSFTNVITQDQARRVEWALNNAVARQAWKNSYAIDTVN